ncbi:MAG TPA: sodium/solute symporter [Acidobacteriota bacterium]
MPSNFSALDWSVLGVYLAASVVLGASFYRKHETAKDYFLAGRSMSWFPVAISIIATDLSALSYIGVPALVYKKDLKYMLGAFLLPVQMFLVILIFIPLFYRLNLFSVYEYLERRFSSWTRLLASLLFMGGRGAWLATMTFATALALSEMSGMNTYAAIFICGFSTTLYTFLGGMEAVIWTDFLQFFVLVGGAVGILGYILSSYQWNVGHIWSVASTTGHTTLFDFSLSLTRENTFWGLLIGLLVFQLSTYATDQVIVQRYFTTKSLKDTVRAVMGSSLIVLPVLLLLYGIGVGLSAYYYDHPVMRASLTNADRVMPHFTVRILPAGIRGLVLAGVFAATMSSISSGINSLTTSTVKDVMERIRPSIRENDLFWARLISAAWGLVSILGASLMVSGKLTVLEKFVAGYQFFAGPLVGMFLLGFLTRRASGGAVTISAVLGFGAALAAAHWTPIHWLWYSPIGCLVTMVLGYGGSLLSAAPNSEVVDQYTTEGDRQLRKAV